MVFGGVGVSKYLVLSGMCNGVGLRVEKRRIKLVIYSSDEAWPSLDEGETRSESIRYLDIFPYINKPSMLCEFDEMGEVAILYHIFAPIGYLLLLLLIIRTARGSKKKKTVD